MNNFVPFAIISSIAFAGMLHLHWSVVILGTVLLVGCSAWNSKSLVVDALKLGASVELLEYLGGNTVSSGIACTGAYVMGIILTLGYVPPM